MYVHKSIDFFNSFMLCDLKDLNDELQVYFWTILFVNKKKLPHINYKVNHFSKDLI